MDRFHKKFCFEVEQLVAGYLTYLLASTHEQFVLGKDD